MMLRLVLMLSIFLFSAVMPAQVRRIKPAEIPKPRMTTLALSAGVSRSVLYLSRNVKENNEATGYQMSLVYGGARLMRGSLDYTYYRPISIEPTWKDIQAHTIEVNAHFIARFKSKKAIFYPLFGFSYNVFKGYFTGINDFLHLSEIHEKNSYVTTDWIGLNVGTGYEYFFRPGSFFIDYKMRAGLMEGTNQPNIMDVCFTAGLRYNFRTPTFARLVKGTRSRYEIDTEKNDW